MSDRSPVRVVIVLAAVLIGGGLYGWNGDDRTAGTGSRAPDAGHAIAMAPRFAPRPYIGKPRPPVLVRLEPRPAMEVGVPAELQLTVHAGLPLSGLTLVLEGDGGLEVAGVQRLEPVSAGPRVSAASVEDSADASYRVLVTPTSGGARSVSGQVRFSVGGVEQAAPFRLEVPVNGPASAASAMSDAEIDQPFRDDVGELIVSMAAETTAKGR